ncbi:MAG: hypothetical protein IPG89_09945 [Bacteroidetes bacterium]|nr:hypothetical protein [Bacteroidota bacterium]
MKKSRFILLLYLLVFALYDCRKKVDFSEFEMELQSYNLVFGSSSVVIDKGSLINTASFYYKYTTSTGNISDLNNNYYIIHSDSTFQLNSSVTNIAKAAQFKLGYNICENSSNPCQIYHAEIKPYKLKIKVGETFNSYSNIKYELIPILNYTYDSINKQILFNETEVNCIYIAAREHL